MKKLITVFICSLCLLLFFVTKTKGDNAPVVNAGIVVNAPVSPATTTVPVTVSNFVDIGSFKLTLKYTAAQLTYISAAPDPAFPGMTVSVTIAGSTATMVINWPASGVGITLPDQTVLLNLTFTYNLTGKRSSLVWSDNGISCQFTKYAGGSYIILNDTPTASYYINGVVTNNPSPVTIAPVITNATAGQIAVPVKVVHFTNIASITLTLEYDPLVLTYVTFIKNPLVTGVFDVGSVAGSGGKKNMVMQWNGSGVTLPDSSILVTLYFTYANTAGNPNYSDLTWIDNGPSCQYSDASFNILSDIPFSDFFKNGLVANQLAPVTWLQSFTNATSSGTLTIPVRVNNFNNIKSLTLSFEYDPAVITYGSFIPNAAFGGTLSLVDNPPGTNGKRTVVISWTGASSLSLPDYSSIVTMDFTYISGTTTLAWVVSDATSCRYNDALGNAYYDKPKATYYQDGLVASHLAPRTAAWYASPATGQQFTVPVKIYSFSNIGLFSLTLDYDPGIITYLSASLVPSIGGAFTATPSGLGRLVFEWTGTPATLAYGDDLINVTFTYAGGTTPLSWFDNGTSCRYAESSVGASLYDQPQAVYYINGYVGPNPLAADFIASNTVPALNETVTFTDLSTGAPTSWYWDFSPANFYFVNGTKATSQNPKVQFLANGVYTATLIIYRGTSGGIKVKTNYITVGQSGGLWTGITSTDWYTGSNWQFNTVPDITTDVVIPSSAPYWPHLTGNLSIGTDCKNIEMNGSSELTIDGNFTINAGASLNVTGSGLVRVGGDWLNAGTFIAGTGTIEFNGSNPGSILSGGSPPVINSFYNLKISKSLAILTIVPDIIVNKDVVIVP